MIEAGKEFQTGQVQKVLISSFWHDIQCIHLHSLVQLHTQCKSMEKSRKHNKNIEKLRLVQLQTVFLLVWTGTLRWTFFSSDWILKSWKIYEGCHSIDLKAEKGVQGKKYKGVALVASGFRVSPIPSHGNFPWPIAKKVEEASTLKYSLLKNRFKKFFRLSYCAAHPSEN